MMDRAILLRHFNALEPIGKTFRHVLLKKARRRDATMITFHRNGTAPQVRQHHRRDHLVVRGQLAFRDAVAGKQDLFRMRDHQSTTASRRGWRSLPWLVHSMNPTLTTIFGSTQCARSRGRPFAFVNGGLGISSWSNCARRSRSNLVSNPVPILPAKTKSPSL